MQYSSLHMQHRKILSKTMFYNDNLLKVKQVLLDQNHHTAFSYDTLLGCQDQNTTLHSAMAHCLDVKIKTPHCIQLRHTAWMSRSKHHTAFSYGALLGCQDQNTTPHSATTHCLNVKIKTPHCIQLRHTAWMSRSKHHTAFSYAALLGCQDQNTTGTTHC